MKSTIETANYLIKKQLGKSVIHYKTSPQQLRSHVQKAFQQQRSYKKKQTIFTNRRRLQMMQPGKQRRKYLQDIQRYRDQRNAGFFICQVLARKKISIPLR